MSLMAPFIVQDYQTILTADPELRQCAILGPKWPIYPKQDFFFWSCHQCNFHVAISVFHCAKF